MPLCLQCILVIIQLRLYFLKYFWHWKITASFLLPAQRHRIRSTWRSVDVTLASVLFRYTHTSHDVQIKWRGSCAICGFAASSFGFGMLRRSGSRGLWWNSLMRRRVPVSKKKKSMRARSRASTHARHIHARACFLMHRFLISERAGSRARGCNLSVNKSRNLYALYAENSFIIQILKKFYTLKSKFSTRHDY